MQRVALTLFTATAMLFGSSAAQAENLMDIYRLAQKNDPQLRAAEAANQAAQATRGQSRAAFLPQISLSANYSQINRDVIKTKSALPDDKYSSHEYTVSLSQSLYHHEYYAQSRQTDAAIAAADAQFEAAKQGTVLRVAQTYFNLLAAQDNLTTAEASKRAISQQLRQTQQRFEVGLSAITDVHEAQAGYDAAVAAELAAQNQLDIAKENLREIVGQEPMALAVLKDEVPLVSPEPANIDEWVNAALKQNLSLIAAQASARVADAELSRRSAGHYPSLDLLASQTISDTTDSATGSEIDNTVVSLQLNVPIFSGGLTTSQTREARALYNQANEVLEQQRRATTREARSAYLGVVTGISQVKARKQALSSAQTALEATQAGFEVGTRTAVDVLNAQQVRFQAQSEYYRSRYDYILATLQLKQAAGNLSDTDLAKINEWLQQ